jgi:hypothetical protein
VSRPQIGINILHASVCLSVCLSRDQADPSHDADVTGLLLITGSKSVPPTCTACYTALMSLHVCTEIIQQQPSDQASGKNFSLRRERVWRRGGKLPSFPDLSS